MGKNVQQVQTPGAAPAQTPTEPSQQPDANEALVAGAADLDMPKPDAKADLPPDLQAVVAAEVAKALGKQRAADAKAAAKGPTETPYDQAVAEQAALPQPQRKPVLTPVGWYIPPGYGETPPKANLG